MSLGLACTRSTISSRRSVELDVDRVGLLGQVPGDVLDDRPGGAADDAVALAGDLVLELVLVVVLVVGVALVEVGGLVAHEPPPRPRTRRRPRPARWSRSAQRRRAGPRRGWGRSPPRPGPAWPARRRARRQRASGPRRPGHVGPTVQLGDHRVGALGLVGAPHAGDGEELLDLLGGLGALAEPGQRPVGVDLDVGRLGAGPVVADGLDDAPVAGRARVGDDHAVAGLLRLAHPQEADLDGHRRGLPVSGDGEASECLAGLGFVAGGPPADTGWSAVQMAGRGGPVASRPAVTPGSAAPVSFGAERRRPFGRSSSASSAGPS